MKFSFAEFDLDTDLYRLHRDGDPRSVEPMVFDLLVFFLKNPDQVFSRDELIDAIWKGRVVSDATVASCVKNARKALGDDGDRQRYIKTVRGRGFLFSAPPASNQTAVGDKTGSNDRDAGSTGDPQADPSLLILPFNSHSDKSSHRQYASIIADQLATILARIPLLQISSQAQDYRCRDVTPIARQIHQETGIDFLLEGNLQQLGEQIRVNIQLLDARTGFTTWSRQFTHDVSLSGALDEVVLDIVSRLEPQLHRAIYRSIGKAGGPASARQLYLEASGILALQGWHHDSFSKAAELLRQSCALAPDFALAHAYLSLVLATSHRVGLTEDRDGAAREAVEAAEAAMRIDNMDSVVLGFAGCALADTGLVSRALPILRNAIELNSSNGQAWVALGSALMLDCKFDEAVGKLLHGIKISPLDSRLSIWGALLSLAMLMSRDLEGAREQAELACQRNDRTYMPRVVLAAVHYLRKDGDGARLALLDAYRIKPDLSASEIGSLIGQRLGSGLLQQVDAETLPP